MCVSVCVCVCMCVYVCARLANVTEFESALHFVIEIRQLQSENFLLLYFVQCTLHLCGTSRSLCDIRDLHMC